MRLVELLGAFMVRLIKQIDMGDFIGANEEVDEMAKKTVGLPLSVLENNQADNLIVMFYFRNGGGLSPHFCRGDFAGCSGPDCLAGMATIY